jgi:hypothetical protein
VGLPFGAGILSRHGVGGCTPHGVPRGGDSYGGTLLGGQGIPMGGRGSHVTVSLNFCTHVLMQIFKKVNIFFNETKDLNAGHICLH